MNSGKLILLGIIGLMPFFASAQNEIEVGATAPAITVTTHLGEQLDLGELYAKGPVAIYFYPKSDTPGCTKQACNIRDNFSDLQAAGVKVIGVSAEGVDKQLAFVEKYSLPFTVVADKERALGKAFGVGSKIGKSFYSRQSYLIVDGKIAWRDLKATPDTQSADLLEALKATNSEQ